MDNISVSSVESGHSGYSDQSDSKLDFGETKAAAQVSVSEEKATKEKVKEKDGKKSAGGGGRKGSGGSKASSAKEEVVRDDQGLLNANLPQSFEVKYLGWQEASGIWGIRYTRKPVDALVSKARQPGSMLSSLTLTVSEEGIRVAPTLASHQRGLKVQSGLFPIQSVSYGVQDLVYTRVFAMITVRDTNNILEHHPFRCHAYVCDSRQTARDLTFTLAQAFKLFSNSVKAREIQNRPRRFAIDLRSPEEMKMALAGGTNAVEGEEAEGADPNIIDDSEA